MKDPGARPETMELTQLQRWFQMVVTHAEGVEAGACSDEAQRLIQLAPGELERVITRSRALTAAERLAIYANAYHTRLLECLGEVFPMLKRTLGEDGFDGLAFGYLQEYPSRSYTLNELGRHFPHYLEQSRPATEDAQEGALFDPAAPEDAAKLQEWNERSPSPQPSPPGEGETPMENWPDFLIDLARLEWAIYEVFDGPGIEGRDPLDANQLLAIPPERWETAKLTPVVCLQLLATRFPVNDYYTALRRAKATDAVPIPSAEEAFVALTRRNFVVRRYNLSRPEFELLQALQAGRSVAEAIALIAPGPGLELDQLAAKLQLWFRNWTAEGFFQSVSVEPSSEGERI
jgi:hypothetical protein